VIYLLCAIFLCAGDKPEPIKVLPDDPIIDLKIQTLASVPLTLANVAFSSYCFFMCNGHV